jgi:hypothetical protein
MSFIEENEFTFVNLSTCEVISCALLINYYPMIFCAEIEFLLCGVDSLGLAMEMLMHFGLSGFILEEIVGI